MLQVVSANSDVEENPLVHVPLDHHPDFLSVLVSEHIGNRDSAGLALALGFWFAFRQDPVGCRPMRNVGLAICSYSVGIC